MMTLSMATAEDLYQPPVMESTDGVLEAMLTVTLSESLDGTRLSPLYNGQPMGPTLKVKPGDVLTLTLNNQLSPISEDQAEMMAKLHDGDADAAEVTKLYNRLQDDGNMFGPQWGQNYMNIHLHGLQVDPNAVDTRVSIGGGESKTYTIQIPRDHPAGLGWYHNHNHGTASFSMLSGLYGIIEVVDPATSALSQPEVAAATPKYLLLAESKVNDDKTAADNIGIVFDFGWTAVTNGQHTPTMTVKTGETVLFRGVSASVEPDYTLAIASDDGAAGAVQVMPVAVDGHPLTGNSRLQDTVTIIPGGRVEFLAKFSTPGSYTMTRAAWNVGITGTAACGAVFGPDAAVENCISYDFEKDVLHIVVEAEAAAIQNPLPASVIAGAGTFLEGLATTAASSTRNVTLQMYMAPGSPFFQLPIPGVLPVGFAQLGINGRIAHPLYEHPDPFVQGSCETWEIGGSGNSVEHPFHLHGMPFLVTHENGEALGTPVWRDTHHTPVVMGDAGPQPGSFTAHVCFTRWNAYIMAHCHMPSHEDLGMAAVFSMAPEPPKVPNTTFAANAANALRIELIASYAGSVTVLNPFSKDETAMTDHVDLSGLSTVLNVNWKADEMTDVEVCGTTVTLPATDVTLEAPYAAGLYTTAEVRGVSTVTFACEAGKTYVALMYDLSFMFSHGFSAGVECSEDGTAITGGFGGPANPFESYGTYTFMLFEGAPTPEQQAAVTAATAAGGGLIPLGAVTAGLGLTADAETVPAPIAFAWMPTRNSDNSAVLIDSFGADFEDLYLTACEILGYAAAADSSDQGSNDSTDEETIEGKEEAEESADIETDKDNSYAGAIIVICVLVAVSLGIAISTYQGRVVQAYAEGHGNGESAA
jgi:FtsP/CotA-like multicopper oxidase with cupredoxin domain